MTGKAEAATKCAPSEHAAPDCIRGDLHPGEASADGGGIFGLIAPAEMFDDDHLASLRSRAMAYLCAGLPVHFRGRAGMGKTTLALALAREIGRPVAFVTGDDALGSAGLVGREIGQDSVSLHDRYIQSVTRSERRVRTVWSDGVLARAVAEGRTLVYDEFTRSPAETNNALLSVLEERVLIVPNPLRGERFIPAHPEFRAIFTSNPEEYAGVKAAPDALFDRMITFDLSRASPGTEAGIVACRTGIGVEDAHRIVRMLHALSETLPGENPPSLRTALMIARVLRRLGIRADARDGLFVQVCLDALETRAPGRATPSERARYLERLRREIARTCPPGATQRERTQ